MEKPVASLGSFAAAVREFEAPAEPDTFEFCGETFTVRGPIPGMVHLTIGASLSGKISGVDSAAAMWEALRHALTVPAGEAGGEATPEDDSEWMRFYRLAVARCVDTEEIAEIAYVLLGAESGRPTGQRSTSTPGPLLTGTNTSSSASATPDLPDSPPADAVSAG